MALIRCAECGREISSDAVACPGCGKPNRAGVNRAKDSSQHIGCAIMIAALFAGALLNPLLGIVLFLVGFVLAALNTRFK